jgi:SAM-dependent methyltransferase
MVDTRIREFWDDRARQTTIDDSEVTHRDVWQRWLEIETIKRYLRPSDRLLDVGCGAGYTTRLIAPLVADAVGVDYSAPMIERARAAAGGDARLRFEVGDVMNLDADRFGLFDVVLSCRCLINLPGWSEQQRAIANIANVLKPGGRFLFLEGLEEGRTQLNEAREQSGLDRMPTVWHNVDFRERQLLDYLEPMFTVADRRHFGVYDFIARVVHPLLVAPDTPQYDSRINQVGARLALDRQDCGDISRVLYLVLERKSA